MSSSQLSVLRRGGFVAAALCLLMLAFHSAPPAVAMPAAPTFTVNSLFDVPVDLADTDYSVCRTAAANSTCTLRAAIMKANRYAGGGVTIIVPAGIYTLTVAPAGPNDDTTGDLNITQTVHITGAGSSSTIIDANLLDRIFRVSPGTAVEIEGLTLQNGRANDGGAIYSQGALTLTAVALLANRSGDDGGAVRSSGSFVLIDSQVTGNQTDYGGRGGGLHLTGSATISNSLISDNDAHYGGGVSFSGSTLLITASEITGNRSQLDAGGLRLGGTVIINNSTVNANLFRVADFPDMGGGGIANYGVLTINNSTVSANSSAARGGGIHNALGATLQLFHVTLAGNISDSHNLGGLREGGGLYTEGTAAAWNSLLADNYVVAIRNDCAGALTSHDYNYVQFNACVIGGATTHNLYGSDPLLGPLGAFGGPTDTRPLLTGSPALDQIPSNLCRDSFGTAPIPDQRGVARPINSLCDIGAHEGAYAPSLYDRNLVQNGDAESGGASPIGANIGTPHWTQTAGTISVAPYGIGGGFPDPATDVVPVERGYNFFAGGPSSPSTAVQTVTVASISTAIDASDVDYAVAADLGGYLAQADSAIVTYLFLNDSNAVLGSAVLLGPSTPSARGSVTGFSHYSHSGTVPAGTRAIRITLTMTTSVGYNDGYADNLELVLTGPLRYVYLPLTVR